MGKGLAVLLIASLLSCSALLNNQDSYSPKFIILSVSKDSEVVSIIEDSHNDGKLDTISNYSMIKKIEPGLSLDGFDNYLLEFKDKEPWVAPSEKNKLLPVPMPEYHDLDLEKRFKIDIKYDIN